MKNRIKMLREQKGMKQRELAEELGVSQNTLSTWETERYEPDAEMLRKIAAALNTSVDYLIGGDPPWSEFRGDQIDFLRINRLMNTVQQLTASQFDQVLKFSQDVLLGGDVVASLPDSLANEDLGLLEAFHAAPKSMQEGIRTMLFPYMVVAEKKKA